MFNLLYTEHIFKAGNIDNPFHKKVLLSTLTISGFVISTFATDFCLIKFSTMEGWVNRKDFYGVYPEEVIN